MLIDIAFIVLLLIAIVKGYSKGLIIAVFSVVALIVGLAAAIKLSALVASWLKASVHVAAKWLPVTAFLIVFIIAVLLVRLGARALEKTAELVWLGWVNKLGGIFLYAALYTLIFSILLFYAEKIKLLTADAIAASKTYYFIKPWGPKAMNGIGSVIPFFKNMFHELEDFFSTLSVKIPGQ
jgi:membrane protein required for colicin V production